MHQNPITHNIERHDAQQDAHVTKQYHVDKMDVTRIDSYIYDRLGYEWKKSLQNRCQRHHKQYERKLPPVWKEIAKDT